MRAIELHSEQLHHVIFEWSSDLFPPASAEQILSFPGTQSYIETIPNPEPYHLPVESEPLFKDLHNHLDNSVMQWWHVYEKQVDGYHQEKQRITQGILDFVRGTTGFKVYDGNVSLPPENVWLHHVLVCVWEDLYRISQDKNPYWFDPKFAHLRTELTFGQNVLKRGSYGLLHVHVSNVIDAIFVEDKYYDEKDSRSPIRDQLGFVSCSSRQEALGRKVYRELSEALNNEEAKQIAKDIEAHQKQYEKLASQVAEIKGRLKEWLEVPILPHECRLLKKGAR